MLLMECMFLNLVIVYIVPQMLIIVRFLLAKIYLDTLVDKVTIADVRAAVAQLPKQTTGSGEEQRLEILNQAYEFAWERIIGQKEGFRNIATRVLGWVTCAKRPLSTKELQHAIAVKVGTDELDEDAIPQVDDMVAFCAGLVTVDEESNVIRLVHYTTEEYFEKTKSNWFPDAEAMIAETCISYLSLSAFEDCCVGKCCLEKELLSQHFLEYACHYWGDHARVVGKKLDDIVMGFLTSGAKASNACTVILDRFYEQPFYLEVKLWQREKLHRSLPTSGLHLAVHFELEEAVKSLIAIGYDINGVAGVSMTPLLIAATRGHTGIARMLIDSGPKIYREYLEAAMQPEVYDERIVETLIAKKTDDKGFLSACLEPAVEFGYEAIVDLLLRKGADVNVVFSTNYGSTGYKPLHVAAQYGQEKIVKLLLDKGVDIDTQAEEPKSHYAPLHVAAKYGQMEIIKLLLDRGAKVDAKFSTGKTPLHVAIKFDQVEIAELLLDKGAKVDANLSNGNTPLHVAAKYGRDSSACTELLLSRGADIEARNNEGRTPLFMMAHIYAMFERFDGSAAIELLLKEGANMEAVDNMGYMPLLFAAERSVANVLVFWMNQGANANAVTYGGQTSLHLAMHNPDPFIIGILLENGADMEAADGEGRSPLLYAVQKYEEGFGCDKQLKNMERLIEKGAITADDNGQTRVSHEIIRLWMWKTLCNEEQRLKCDCDGRSESVISYHEF
jgi:ankyrin repeat protein